MLAVHLAVSVATGDLACFWPMWVIGPRGAALLASRVAAGRVDAARRGQVVPDRPRRPERPSGPPGRR